MVSIQRTSAPASARCLALLGEDLDALLVRERAERCEQLTGGADAAGDGDRTAGLIGGPAGDRHGGGVELGHPGVEIVEGQAEAVAAEGVGEDDVGAGVDEAAMDLFDQVGLLDIEQLRTTAAFEAEGEESGAHGSVGDQGCAGG